MSRYAADWNDLQKTLDRLVPAQKLWLIEELARSLRAATAKVTSEDLRASLDRLRRELDSLPVHNPADGFSARDHDRELYGEAG